MEYIDANTIYAGRLRSFDNGVTWEEIPNNPGWVTAVENKGQETLYAGKCENFGIASPVVYKSIDDGETWSPLGLILNNVEAPKICLSKQSPGVILISIRTLGIYRSSDYGENWTQVLNAGVSQYQIYQHPSRQGCFFAACTAGYFPGVYRSLDDGKTWENMTPGYNARSIGLDPIHEGNVCAYLGDKFGVSGQPGAKLVFFSEDLGQTFSSLGNAPFDQNNGVFILSIAIDSTFDRKIYAGFSQGRGIYRNIGTENNWSACIDEMKAHLVNDIVIDNLDYCICACNLGF